MNPIRMTIIYLKMSVKAIISKPSLKTVSGIFRFFPRWMKHLAPGKNSVSDSMPWICFAAVEFIKKIIRSDMVVFEYGSGGSTLFWAEYVSKVVSVEHEPIWYKKMSQEFSQRKLHNIEYILAEPKDCKTESSMDYANPQNYLSSDISFKDKSFEVYVKQIDKFPDKSFDIIIIDGRARPSCIARSLSKLKENGYLVIDNTEREYYLSPFKFERMKWNTWKFYGPVPYIYHFSETSIFQKLFVAN